MIVLPDFNVILAAFTALVGYPILVAAIVNGLKAFNVVADGDAPKVVAGFDLVGLIGLLVVTAAVPSFDVKAFDGQLGGLAAFITVVVGFAVQMGASKLGHASFKGLPVIGKSFTQDK